MNSEILNEGLNLMAFGMGAVFVFLTVLVIATSIMSIVIGKFFPASQSESKLSNAFAGQVNDQQLISAIMAAIKLHRARKNK